MRRLSGARAANQKGSKPKRTRCDCKDSATDGAGTCQLRLGGLRTLLFRRGASCLGFSGAAGCARLIALRRGRLSRKRASQRHRSQAQVAGKGCPHCFVCKGYRYTVGQRIDNPQDCAEISARGGGSCLGGAFSTATAQVKRGLDSR